MKLAGRSVVLSAGSPVTSPSVRMVLACLVSALCPPSDPWESSPACRDGLAGADGIDSAAFRKKDFLTRVRARQVIVTRMGRDPEGLGGAQAE